MIRITSVLVLVPFLRCFSDNRDPRFFNDIVFRLYVSKSVGSLLTALIGLNKVSLTDAPKESFTYDFPMVCHQNISIFYILMDLHAKF